MSGKCQVNVMLVLAEHDSTEITSVFPISVVPTPSYDYFVLL